MFTKLTFCFLFFYFNQVNSYITYIEAKYPLQGGEKVNLGSPWPLPQSWTKYPFRYALDSKNFVVLTNAQDCLIVKESILRLKNIIVHLSNKQNYNQTNDLPQLSSIFVEIDYHRNCNHLYPQQGDNEYYEIEISNQTTSNNKIRSNTIWGALRALETFSQLIYTDHETKQLVVNATKINDWPRFKFRGIMLDTARHFLPKNVLLANLDAMSYNKMNVFHWHIVDDQSFPLESKYFPQLTKQGAYSPKHIYTQDDIMEIIEYARFRGIRVIPEIDTPGHTQSFGRAFPFLLTPCYGQGYDKPYTANYPKHANAEMLNPIQNFTYDFMKLLFEEVRYLFVDEYIHLGMDEVYYDCWKSNPKILQFMKEHKMTNMNQIEQFYAEKTVENVKNLGYKYLIWQDPVDNGVKVANDTVVVVWKENHRRPDSHSETWKQSALRIIKQGYDVVVSACWYLNYINYGQDWEKYYQCDPGNIQASGNDTSKVIGGEACLWGEYVDGTNALSRLWPRASAVAERLWSDPSHTKNLNEARLRLDQQRCRMLQRGIPAQPILNGFCGDYEWEMENEI